MRLFGVFERYFTPKLPTEGMIMIPSGVYLAVRDADRSLSTPNLPSRQAMEALRGAHHPVDGRADRLWHRRVLLDAALISAS